MGRSHGASDKSLPQLFCITHSVNLHLYVNMHAKGGKSQTEETAETQSECQMPCYRMGDVLLMSQQQISVFGVKRLCVHSVWVIQIKVTAIWSSLPNSQTTEHTV